MLKWEILESALGSAPEGAPGNWGCSGGCSRECSEKLGALQGVLPRVLFLLAPNRKSTLGSTPWSTHNFPEHSREHPPEHPQFPGAPSGALPRALSRISHFSTPVTGGWDRKHILSRPCGHHPPGEHLLGRFEHRARNLCNPLVQPECGTGKCPMLLYEQAQEDPLFCAGFQPSLDFLMQIAIAVRAEIVTEVFWKGWAQKCFRFFPGINIFQTDSSFWSCKKTKSLKITGNDN